MPSEDPPEGPVAERDLARFVSEPTEDLADWRWLWEGDHQFPIEGRPGPIGKLLVFLKRLLRPLVRAPQADLWDRQRQFNLILLSHLENLRTGLDDLGSDLQQVQKEIVGDLHSVEKALVKDLGATNDDLQDLNQEFSTFKDEAPRDLARQTEALFSILDQKVERLRSEADGLTRAVSADRSSGSD